MIFYKKLFLIVGFVLLFGIFSLDVASSISVSPARTTIDFVSGTSREISVTVYNIEDKQVSYSIQAQGELASYISDYPEIVSFEEGEPSKVFTYTINLPESLDPGINEGGVSVTELADENSGAQVFARVSVVSQLYVYSLHPGKFANADFKIISADKGEKVEFIFPIASQGTFDITNIRAQIDIKNAEGELVDSFTTPGIAVPSGEKKDLKYLWTADFPEGEYTAFASLIYDEDTLSFERNFHIGDKDLELEDIYVEDFSLGEIVKLEMLVRNNWNKPLERVYLLVDIYDDTGVVSSFESASHTVNAKSKYSFNAFWDTEGVLPGSYFADIGVHYDEYGLSRETVIFEVSENELKIIGLGNVVSSSPFEVGTSSILWIVIGALVVVIIVILIVLYRRGKRGRKRKK